MNRFLWTFYTYVASFNFFAWLPIFFLFFNERVTTEQVLLLEAIYYAAVVLAEIPCGMISDRFGRWQTLAATMVGLLMAYSMFWMGTTFWSLAVAQILLGVSFALNSGTDTALLFETLQSQDRAHDYPGAEARSAQVGLFSTGIAVVLGSAVSTWSLRYAYGLSVVAALIGLLAAWQLRRDVKQEHVIHGVWQQFRQIGAAGRKPIVRVIFAFVVMMTILNHVPYEFAQPYLKFWVEKAFPGLDVGLVTGVVTATGLFVGAIFSRRLVLRLREWSMVWTMFTILAFTIVIIAILGGHQGWLGVGLLCLRTLPASLSRSLANIWISPYLSNAIRATYLSVQSLIGRLSFSLVLMGLSQLPESQEITQADLHTMLSLVAALAAVVAAVFLGSASRLPK